MPATVQLREIDHTNLDEVLKLTVSKTQEGFVSTVRDFLNQVQEKINTGYGRQALLLALELLKKRFGATKVFLGVSHKNEAAYRLYHSVGFRETRKQDDRAF